MCSELRMGKVWLPLGLTLLSVSISQVSGHGRLLWPPARGTVFRHAEFADLKPIPNYNDNELNCGGAYV